MGPNGYLFCQTRPHESNGDESTSRSHARMDRIVDGFENSAAKITGPRGRKMPVEVSPNNRTPCTEADEILRF